METIDTLTTVSKETAEQASNLEINMTIWDEINTHPEYFFFGRDLVDCGILDWAALARNFVQGVSAC